MRKLFAIVIPMLLCISVSFAQYGFYNLSEAEGTWKDEYSDDNLKVMLNPATGCGKVTWNPNYYIEFNWQVWLNGSGQPEPSYPDASAGNATFYKLAFTQTASNAPDIAQFGSMIAYYSPNFNNAPAITQYTRMWYCKRTGGSGIAGNCGGSNSNNNNNSNTNSNNGNNNPNSNGGNGNGSGTGTNNGNSNGGNGTGSNNTQYDTELTNLINQMQQYLANGNTAAANNILNQILQIAQHAYPDQLDELQNIYNQASAQAQQTNSGNNNSGSSNNNGSGSSHGMVMGSNEADYPEGWAFLQDYQNMLNEYIRQFNLIADGGGNINNLVAYANKLQNFILSNQHIFGRLTARQMEVLQRMMDYFQKVMLQAANASLGKMQRIERCNYAEVAMTGYVPAINPQFTTLPTTPAPTSSPNSNSSLSGGGSVTPPSINGTGPDGMKRP